MGTEYKGRDDFYREARNDIAGPLEGIRVLEVTTTWAGPRAGCVLAEYGADVVRVELAASPDICRLLPPQMPGTDPPDGYLNVAVNKNKRSIHLDLRQESGRAVFHRLLADVDVVVENFKTGMMSKWGCGYAESRATKPDIIFVSITGYGQFGPYAENPGYDPAAQAYSGFMWMNPASDEDVPLRAPIFLADELAGLHGALGAMAALRHRDRTGEGQHVDVSLLDAVISGCTGLHALAANGLPTPRFGNPMPFAAPTGVYRCKDGFLYFGVLLDTHWRILAKMIDRPELGADPDYATFVARVKRRAEVDAILAEWCAERTRSEIVTLCEQNELAVAPVLTPAEAIEDPQVQARETIQPVEHPNGKMVSLEAPAAKLSRTPIRNRSYAPLPGAHTGAVLAEAGYSAEEIEALRAEGIIG